MKLAEFIKVEKTVDNYGSWATGHIARSSWPMRSKELKQSPDWHWRVVSLTVESRKFRVLLKLNTSIEQFYAILGELSGDAITVLCSHELHTSHGNWHCHATLGQFEDVFAGVFRDKDSHRRWPSYNGPSREVFDVDGEKAMKIAANLYRFEQPGQVEFF